MSILIGRPYGCRSDASRPCENQDVHTVRLHVGRGGLRPLAPSNPLRPRAEQVWSSSACNKRRFQLSRDGQRGESSRGGEARRRSCRTSCSYATRASKRGRQYEGEACRRNCRTSSAHVSQKTADFSTKESALSGRSLLGSVISTVPNSPFKKRRSGGQPHSQVRPTTTAELP